MIVVDTSALVAIYLGEPDAEALAARIAGDEDPVMSVASFLECTMVLRAKKRIAGAEADAWLEAFVGAAPIRLVEVDLDQAQLAREAHRRYGKGMGPSAQLNFGDCFAYALARSLDAPLLFKGNDFSQTDIVSAL